MSVSAATKRSLCKDGLRHGKSSDFLKSSKFLEIHGRKVWLLVLHSVFGHVLAMEARSTICMPKEEEFLEF